MYRSVPLWVLIFSLLAACGATPAAPTPSAKGDPAAPAELVQVNLCYTAPTTTQAIPWYALETGLFEKYGLQVNLIRVQGSSRAMTTLITGDADLCQAAGTALINAAAAGQDMVMIAGIYNTYPTVLIAKPEIASVAELRGMRVGTGLPGSASHLVTDLALRDLGLDPDMDVLLLEVGEVPDRVTALRANQIDATLTDAPYVRGLREDGFRELYNFGNSGIPYAHTSIMTTRRFVAEHREVALNFMKAIVDAVFTIKRDPEGAKAVLAKYLGLDVVENAADLADAYEEIIVPFAQELPYPNPEGLQTLIDAVAEENPDAASLVPADLTDLSIVQELEASGFIEGLRAR